MLQVPATGPGGRLLKGDVLAYLEGAGGAAGAGAAAQPLGAGKHLVGLCLCKDGLGCCVAAAVVAAVMHCLHAWRKSCTALCLHTIAHPPSHAGAGRPSAVAAEQAAAAVLAAAGALVAGAAAAAGPQAVAAAAAGEESMEPVVVQLRGYRKVGCWERLLAGFWEAVVGGLLGADVGGSYCCEQRV